MKKQSHYVTYILLIPIAIFVLNACTKKVEKFEDQSAYNNQLKSTPISLLKNEIKAWKMKVNENNNFDVNVKKRYNKIEDEIDFTQSIMINNFDGSTTLFFSLQPEDGLNRYLFLKKNGEVYKSEEVYKTTITLQYLNLFLNSKNLKKGEKVELWSLKNHPIKGWETTKEGRRVYKILKQKIVKSKEINNTIIQGTSGSVKVNRMDDPEAGVCIEWYWIVYDEDTNEILYEEYMFSTGNCGSGGNTSTASPNTTTCNFTDEEAEEIVNSSESFYVNEVSNGGDGSASVLPDGKIRGNAIPKWKFGGMRFGIGGTWFYTSYNGVAHYSGKRYRNNANDPTWKYESLSFSSASVEEEANIICLGVTLEITAHAETISSSKESCEVSVSYKMQGVVTCLNGVKRGDALIDSNSTELYASSNY